MMPSLPPVILVLALLLPATSAAAQTGLSIIPILASSELAQGLDRFISGIVDAEGRLIAAPDVEVRLRFYDDEADPEVVAFEADARFVWAIEEVRGLYASDIVFPHAGRWGTRFDVAFPDGRTEIVRVDYDVQETTATPPIGAPAPQVETPTAADADGDLRRISTDPEPLARFYERSIDEAVTSGAPAVIAFATPTFCQSATCGPTLEKVKAVAEHHPEVVFVHVEPYVMSMQEGRLQPVLSEASWLQAAPWTTAWGLRSEPYVFVVDGDGLVRARLEGAISTDELEDALAALRLGPPTA